MRNNTDFIYLLRFIAAFIVVLKHYSPIRNTIIDNGGEAVSFFFLLSGFILVVAYEKQIMQDKLSAKSFYIKRIARVYPLYILALFLTLAYHFLIKNSHTHLALKLPFELTMTQSWLFPGSINYPAWSISCELCFYLLFPLYILKIKHLSLRSSVFMVLFLLISTVLVSYLIDSVSISFLKNELKSGYLYEHPLFRIPVFFFGNILGFMYIKNIKVPLKTLILMLFFGCLSIYLWTFEPVHLGLSLKQLGLLFIYAVLIIGLLQNSNFSKKYLSHKTFILLGDISYGIYLLQFPVSSFVFAFTNGFNPFIQFSIYLIVLIVFSYLTYQYFEKPLRAKIVEWTLHKNHNLVAIGQS
jgi:peptidoglycan/LPS O-acetylase OafA/YrhL